MMSDDVMDPELQLAIQLKGVAA